MMLANDKLAILIPITSRGGPAAVPSVLKGLQRLASSLAGSSAGQGLHRDASAGHGLGQTSHVDSCTSTDLCGLPQIQPASCSTRHSESMVAVLLGIDADDNPLLQHQQACVSAFTAVGVAAAVLMLSDHEPGAVCQIWSDMAQAAAVDHGCNLAVLLGDDTELSPHGWPDEVLTAFRQQHDLMLLLLNDVSDPGFPSFFVIRIDRHLEVFGKLLPQCFINQGGDPYLAALYRRWHGTVQMLPDVTVRNTVGGVQRSDQPYTAPRYKPHTVSKETMMHELQYGTRILEDWHSAEEGSRPNSSISLTPSTNSDAAVTHHAHQAQLTASTPVKPSSQGSIDNNRSSAGNLAMQQVCAEDGRHHLINSDRQLAVDVLVPSYRVDLQYLKGIAHAVLDGLPIPDCDLQLVIVVDQSASSITSEAKQWLHQLQQQHLHKVRVRFNKQNMGASATRNTALQESLAEYVIFWDDDITPSRECIAAYVQAMKQHPQALGFVGPSYVVRDPSSVWACAVHQADVLFFWDAAQEWKVAEVVPWAVTANVALVNTSHQFDLRFPKTGGGEDIDYCLKVTGGGLVPVPQAAVHHPLWNNGKRCYNRFFGWANGDGALMAMYPQLCYYNWPNSAELLCMLLLLAGAAAAAALVLAATAAAPYAWRAPASASGMLQYCSVVCLTAAVGYKAVDLLLDVIRAFHPVRVAKHPCNTILIRLAAAAEASLIKTWSEVGRLWGLVRRIELFPAAVLPVAPIRHTGDTETAACSTRPRVCQRFDWFCGLSPDIVAAEKRRGFWRFAACCAGAWAAAAVAVRVLQQLVAIGVDTPMMPDRGTDYRVPGMQVVAVCAAWVAGCGFMLWRLEY